MRAKGIIGLVMALGVLAATAPATHGAEAPDAEQASISRTPPRLSFMDGQVSFWRPGAQDWAQAQINIPLAPGDELFTGSPGNLELQIGSRAFVRAWANTQIGLENQEPDFLQFKVTAGHASFDIRTLDPGQTLEVDTPNAAFTIEHTGYYRVEVAGERTSFITRRGGRATVTPANGEAAAITPSEEVVIEGTPTPQVASYAAPPLDSWDKWNYTRTDELVDAVSARYVPSGVYGVDDLDVYGTWRVVPTYGSVWVPTAVQAGWVPYSTGSWVTDPFYGWSWVDAAPWGWAPYHYGRWVFVDGFWAWAPGPVVVRPAYAPALVGFFGGPGVGINIGWVALGWGEPCVPWWGPAGFIHRAWWGGWGGPRIVNNVVINRTTVVNVESINVYRNASVRNAMVVVNENHFGHGPITSARLAQVDMRNLHPIHTEFRVNPTPASFAPTASRGIRPPEDDLRRSVVATRAPHPWAGTASRDERKVGPAGVPMAPPRLVSVPRQPETTLAPHRPPFGRSTVERSTTDRKQVLPPPTLESPRRADRGVKGGTPLATPQVTPKTTGPAATAPASPAPRVEASRRLPEGVPPVTGQKPPQVTGPVPATPPAPTPRVEASRRSEGVPGGLPSGTSHAPLLPKKAPQISGPVTTVPSAPVSRVETSRRPTLPLPGEPANRLSPARAEKKVPAQTNREAPARRPDKASGNQPR
jgi:hypothetical protein